MRSLFLISLVVVSVVLAARAESYRADASVGGDHRAPRTRNPLVERWPADVLFYQSFDTDSMMPDIGYAAFNEKAKGVRFEEGGVLGSCYAGTGRFDYRRRDRSVRLIDTTKPGSLVVWVKYLGEREPIRRTNGQWEPGFGILQITGGTDNGNTFYLMKSADCRWPNGSMKFHLQSTKPDGKIFRGGAVAAPSPFVGWKPGEWRMVAVGWTVDALRISINGEPFKSSPLEATLGDFNGHFFLTNDDRTRLDELVVLGRPLSDEEVMSVYDAMKP